MSPASPSASPAHAPAVGDDAPDVELPDTDGAVRRLRDLRGAPVVLAFYPGHDDGPRESQAAGEQRDVAVLAGRGVHVYGIAVADHPQVARRFGIEADGAIVVVDENGRIARRDVTTPAVSSPRRARWSRREFIAAAIGAAVGLTLARSTAAAQQLATIGASDTADEGTMPVMLDVNGRRFALALDTRVTLLDALREHAGITGPKKGCDHGQCGACTVHVNGRRVLACLTLAAMAQGKRITTVEGLSQGTELHPLQQAFIEHDGFQCGYCTSGQLMSAAGMLDEPWGPSDDDVREAMSGNICRCGAYPGIVAAIQAVRTVRGAER